jgi:hypothetical protein
MSMNRGMTRGMDRQSDKRNPRLDEEMKRETDTRTTPSEVMSTSDAGTGSLTPEEVELRTDLARFVDRIFPATKAEIVENAQGNGAPGHVVSWYKRLPDRTFEGFPEVWEIGSGHDEPRVI